MVGVGQAEPRFATVLAGATWVLVVGVLLFARLGHYALWDDEALVALAGEGVMRTGDTSVVIDHNVVAYRDGLLVRDLHDRSTPPLSAYLAAASMSLFGLNAAAARLPFALLGLGAVTLGAWWLRRERVGPLAQAIAALLLVGNVSFFLYCRQCRYYAPAIFLSMAVAFTYLSWRGQRRVLVAMALLSVALFAASYLAWLALYACLLLDYLGWRRHERSLGGADWLALAVPQLAGCGLVALAWNPLRTPFGGYLAANTLADRITLFFWSWRDLNACEFFAGGLLVAAIAVALLRRDRALLRALAALLAYVLVITLCSPQVVANTTVADLRYLVPVIPLGIAIGTLAIVALLGKTPIAALALAAVASCSNLLHGGPWSGAGLRSTLADYCGELADPPGDPYTPTAQWINDHVRDGASVWVLPEYMAYPLMFHAPKALYAWQLRAPPQPQFSALPAIHFRGQVLPDYVVAFGDAASQQMARALRESGAQGLRYERVATIDAYWRDLYRPELFWRTFRPVTDYDRNREAIYVFARAAPGRAE